MALGIQKGISLLLAAVLVCGGAFLSNAAFPSRQALAQGGSDDNIDVQVDYESTYPAQTADVTKPLTIGLEQHLYHPGDIVEVRGSVWTEMLKQVEALNVVKIEIKDSAGNVVAREEATIVESDGSYSASPRILESAGKGTYGAEARIELEADALGIVESITSAALQSSMRFAVATPEDYPVVVEDRNFTVVVASNSGINDFQFKQQEKRISFFVEGESGTKGVTEVTIPKELLGGEMAVFMDQNLVAEEDVIVKSQTAAETTFEINYSHSIHRMEVTGTSAIPEFPIAALAGIAAVIGSVALISRAKIPLFRQA